MMALETVSEYARRWRELNPEYLVTMIVPDEFYDRLCREINALGLDAYTKGDACILHIYGIHIFSSKRTAILQADGSLS